MMHNVCVNMPNRNCIIAFNSRHYYYWMVPISFLYEISKRSIHFEVKISAGATCTFLRLRDQRGAPGAKIQ